MKKTSLSDSVTPEFIRSQYCAWEQRPITTDKKSNEARFFMGVRYMVSGRGQEQMLKVRSYLVVRVPFTIHREQVGNVNTPAPGPIA